MDPFDEESVQVFDPDQLSSDYKDLLGPRPNTAELEAEFVLEEREPEAGVLAGG